MPLFQGAPFQTPLNVLVSYGQIQCKGRNEAIGIFPSVVMVKSDFIRRNKVVIGSFLILEGAGSIVFFLDQFWLWQVGRLIRIGIGVLLLRIK